ncbi:MAG: nucleotidyltransferase domain-containing protein [Candidatus Margulisiibacteriota bacterium]|jgi:predicted nucleotidyltransferase
MIFGLRETDLTYISDTLRQFEEIKKAILFGSRAKGNFKKGSDIDIAIDGDNITFSTVSRLQAIFEDESPMPYKFDIVDYSHLNHDELKEHINRVGVVFYER